MKQSIFGLVMAATIGSGVAAEENEFVISNLASVLYHELGHAIIDQMQLPIFGQEEDAADVLSVLLIDRLYQEENAQAVAYDAAFGFDAEAQSQPIFWDTHGPDEQRYFNLICLFYGANPDERDDLAQELGLPEERAISCEEEFEIANDSWGPVLDEMAELKGQLVYKGPEAGLYAEFLSQEVEFLAEQFRFPIDIDVKLEDCGEANAYYDLQDQSITMCSEFEGHLREQFSNF